ncbi:MAG TPA: DUF3224 domain-containing protein [Candidatus Dormibacteraeota bacterium]|nr:DUF3224 domain-containing protein [Candidatus Dormibacteraeota bacterium]
MARVKGKFHVTDWKEETIEELAGKGKVTRAHITQDYTGGLEGHGAWDLLMCYRDDGTAVYTGYMKFDGGVGEKKGVLVMKSEGTFDGGAARTKMSVVPHAGSGGLEAFIGKGSSVAPHGSEGTYDLELTRA